MFSNCLEVCLVIYFSKLLSWKGGVCRHFSPAGNCGSNFPHVKLWLKSFGCLFKLIGMKNLWQNSLFKTALYISWKNFSWQYSRKVSSNLLFNLRVIYDYGWFPVRGFIVSWINLACRSTQAWGLRKGILTSLSHSRRELFWSGISLANTASSEQWSAKYLYEMRLKPRQIESWLLELGLLEQRQDADQDLDSCLLAVLKDGAILCRLVNRLKPETIAKVKQRFDI